MSADPSSPYYRLEKHHDKLLTYVPEEKVIGVFLHGSQNYQLAHRDSDVDSVAIVCPTLRDIALLKEPMSTSIPLGDEHMVVKDIRVFVNSLRKCHLTFIEVLFSCAGIISTDRGGYYRDILFYKEDIARMNQKQMVKAIAGHAMTQFFRMKDPQLPAGRELLKSMASMARGRIMFSA